MRWRAAFIADEPRPTTADIILAAGLCLAALLQAAAAGITVAGVAVAVLLGVAVLGARITPLPAVALLCAAIALAAAAGMVPDDQIALVVATIVVCYRIAAWAAVPVAVITAVAVVTCIVTTTPHTLTDVLWESVLMVLPVVGGWAMKRHRRVLRDLEVAYAELDATRHERAAAAVDAERLRIARELHDVIAHGVSVMVVQAGAADAAWERDAATARRAVQAIERTGTDALRELRGLLGVLRTTDGDPSRSVPRGLSDLDHLVREFGDAGLAVRLDRDGPEVSIPAGVDLAAYRIVQQALTNALAHGSGPGATVRVRTAEEELALTVSNACTATTPPVARHGIAGMRERAAAFGGTVEIRTDPRGEFVVAARLPLEVL
ncbi:MAG: hypothetical protein JSS74_06495 [Actinobacteria bacterium]|nr:hypothetical protein [Actinomycetota bacterium]